MCVLVRVCVSRSTPDKGYANVHECMYACVPVRVHMYDKDHVVVHVCMCVCTYVCKYVMSHKNSANVQFKCRHLHVRDFLYLDSAAKFAAKCFCLLMFTSLLTAHEF